MKKFHRLQCLALVLMSALPLFAEISPNGREYDIVQDGLYYKHFEADARTQERYKIVDADYVENMIVPDAIDDIPVTDVVDFFDRVDIESVRLGSNIRYVNFRRCEYITSFDFGEAKSVDGYIQNLTSLETLTIPENCSLKIQNCSALKSAVFTGKNKSCYISDCTALENTVFSEGTETLPKFSGCTSLDNVRIPASVLVLSGNFTNCTKLENVEFAPGSSLELIWDAAFSKTGIKYFHW